MEVSIIVPDDQLLFQRLSVTPILSNAGSSTLIERILTGGGMKIVLNQVSPFSYHCHFPGGAGYLEDLIPKSTRSYEWYLNSSSDHPQALWTERQDRLNKFPE